MTISTVKAIQRSASPLAAIRRISWRGRLWPESGAASPIPALDGLRAVAALLVLAFHAWSIVPTYVSHGEDPTRYPLWYAKTGVHLFFVLSGFLLFLPYAQWILGLRARPDTLLFYKRRALRVVPAYWASLLIIVVLIHPAAIQDILIHLVFLTNTNWTSVFSINGVYWTMAIEVQFYALLPLIAWSIAALGRRIGVLRAIAAVIFMLTVISVLSSYVTHLGSVNLLTTPIVSSFLVQYAAMPYWLGVFGCGIVCSLIYTYITKVLPPHADVRASLPLSGNIAFGAGIVCLVLLSFVPALRTIWMQQLLFGVAYAGVLFGVLLGSPLLRRPFASRVLRFIGLTSYSFYIWHRAALVIVASRLHGSGMAQSHTVILFALGLIIIVPVAYLSYQFLERPFISARQHARESDKSVVAENVLARVS